MWHDTVEVSKGIWNLPEQITDEKKVYSQVKKYYSDPKIDLVAVMKNGIKFLMSWFDDHPHVLRVILEFWCQVNRNEMITGFYDNTMPHIRKISGIIIQEGIKRGVFKRRDPKRAAYVLISAISGMAINQSLNSGEYDHKALEKDISDLVLGYLLK